MPYKKAALRLHAGLSKPHSSLLTQLRTGKIGLAGFLHTCRVPGFESLACPCGWQQETAKHVVLDCPRFHREQRQLRQAVPTTDFQQLTSNLGTAATVTTWFLQLDLLSPSSPGPGTSFPPPPPPPPLLDCKSSHIICSRSLDRWTLPSGGVGGGRFFTLGRYSTCLIM